MDIQFTVGRRQGRHSQNTVADQALVRSLLNRIPTSRGGADRLDGNLLSGICGDRFYEAILHFQRTHFGSAADGHVDPGGPTIRLLNQLAEQALQTASPHMRPAGPLPPAQNRSEGPRLPDGGSIVGDPIARRSAAWTRFRLQVSGSLRGNPNLAAVTSYLDGLQRSAGAAVVPVLMNFVAFGDASADGRAVRLRAQVLHQGSRVGTFDNQNAVILSPGNSDDNAGGVIQLGPNTLFVVLGRNSSQVGRREGAADTTLQTGNLRSYLGQLAGRR